MSLMRFPGFSSQTQTHLAQFSFAHTLVGRWAFQLSAGPQFVRLEDFGPLSGDQWSWSLTSSLTYQTHHANYLLTYVRGVTSGAGVIIGAETNVADRYSESHALALLVGNLERWLRSEQTFRGGWSIY